MRFACAHAHSSLLAWSRVPLYKLVNGSGGGSKCTQQDVAAAYVWH